MSEEVERVVSSTVLYRGRLLTLRRDEVEMPSGRRAVREVVVHPGAVVVAPLLEDDLLVMIRQYRHAVGRTLLEIPAGTLEEGESPETCALRELEEETGFRASRLRRLFSFFIGPGYTSELIHAFEARGLSKAEARAEFDELIRVVEMPLEEAVKMVFRNEIADAKTICTIMAIAFERRLAGSQSQV